MGKFIEELTTSEEKFYTFKIGKKLASSLAGFIAGLVVATLIWLVYFLPLLP